MPAATPATVHPHVRGEEDLTPELYAIVVGPPPRAWGRVAAQPLGAADRRSTPTCVGKRPSRKRGRCGPTVHPHVRGEEEVSRCLCAKLTGPPPRAWGREEWLLVVSSRWGSTPTCVGKRVASRRSSTFWRVHPHVRGEERDLRRLQTALYGPPPRAWGRVRSYPRGADDRRSTPTCVGKSCCWDFQLRRLAVHPHVRGEEILVPKSNTGGLGPPPRAWGRAHLEPSPPSIPRSTPTCVGKRLLVTVAAHVDGVHPHVRGEEPAARYGASRSGGPPPRAWGRGRPGGGASYAAGSTPTCVGKRRRLGARRCRPAVHPHVRGEEAFAPHGTARAAGPPPRAWGRERGRDPAVIGAGSTPTCVGKRPPPPGRASRPSVHPHVRGEETRPATARGSGTGPPPRAWGRACSSTTYDTRGGSTPTCVGKSARSRQCPRRRSVHPHVRGEEFIWAMRTGVGLGPPPRAWGRGCARRRDGHRHGSTPTCVGKS